MANIINQHGEWLNRIILDRLRQASGMLASCRLFFVQRDIVETMIGDPNFRFQVLRD
jgi:hypothetical protein